MQEQYMKQYLSNFSVFRNALITVLHKQTGGRFSVCGQTENRPPV